MRFHEQNDSDSVRNAAKRSINRQAGRLLRTYARQMQELHDLEKQFLALFSQIPGTQLVERSLGILTGQTVEHVSRLELIMKRLGVHPLEAHSRETSPLLTNLRRLLKQSAQRQGSRHEAALLSALHKLKSFEVACYATAHSYARLLSFHDDLVPLERTYHEQKAMEERIETLMRQLKRVARNVEFEMSV